MYLSRKQVRSGSRLCEINDGSSAIWPEGLDDALCRGNDRSQSTLFPQRLNNYLGEDNNPS